MTQSARAKTESSGKLPAVACLAVLDPAREVERPPELLGADPVVLSHGCLLTVEGKP